MVFSVNVKAYSINDFADNLAECLASPCSCGQKEVKEEWGADDSNITTLLGDIANYTSPANPANIANVNPLRHNFRYANQACMPFNRYSGRVGCLKQFQPPITPFLPTYRVYCAEADPNSSATNPSIVLRMQACNLFSCFTKSTSLNAGGAQCVTWPTQYGIPTIRFCARVSANRISQMQDTNNKYLVYSSIVPVSSPNYAPPDSPLLGRPVIKYTEDDGYMYHFLDTNGYPRPDGGVPNGSGYQLYLPKICLYEDPSYVEALSGGYMESYRLKQPNGTAAMDTYDRNIYSQFLHYGSDGGHQNPGFMAFMGTTVNQNLYVERKFFFTGQNSYFYNSNPAQIADENNILSDKSWNNKKSPWGNNSSDYAKWVDNFVAKKYNSLGCTHLPLGPYPPPFCPTLAAQPSGVTMQPICATTTIYNPNSSQYVANYIDSTLAEPCVKSTVNNNFIQNAVRASVDSITPICLPLNATGSLGTGFCATVKLNGATLSSIYNSKRDTLPKCVAGAADAPPVNAPCVTPPPVCNPGAGTPPPLNCAATDITPASGNFRIVYGMQAYKDGPVTPLKGYPSDIAGNICSSNNILYPCVTIYGVNTGAYSDVIFDLGNIAITSSNFYKSPNISLRGLNDSIFTVSPYISYQGIGQANITPTPAAGNLKLPPNSMCVSYINNANPGKIKNAGCTKRAPPPQLRSYCCSNPGSPVTVQNNDLSTTSVPCTPAPAGATTACNWSEDLAIPPSHYNTNPQMIVGLDFVGVTAGTSPVPTLNSAYTKVVPRDLKGDQTDPSKNNYTNLIGYLLDTIVVDSNYFLPPFLGNHVIPEGNTVSIFGNYQGCTYPVAGAGGNLATCNFPVNMNGLISAAGQTGLSSTPPTNPLPPYYLGGIEYANGKYQRGGSFLYAGPVSEAKCHAPIAQSNATIIYDDSYCVLTKLNYADALNCSSFKTLFSAYNQCPNNASSCTPISPAVSLPFNTAFGGGPAVSLKSCVVLDSSGNSVNQTCYEPHTSLTLPICSASILPQDRALPKPIIVDASNKFNPPAPASPAPPIPYRELTSAQIASISLNSNEFYNSGLAPSGTFCAAAGTVGAESILFDSNKCAIRDKTMFELGVSAPIPYMFCPAVAPATEATGYATWSLAPLGGQSIGTCKTGYYNNPGLVTRTCKADMKNNVFLDLLTASTTCLIQNCPAITTASNLSGFATWSAANYGTAATGTCASGYSPPSGGLGTRNCNAQAGNDNGLLDSITTATTCLADCSAITTARSATGWGIFSATTSSATPFTGSCPSGFTQNPSGPPKLVCASTGNGGTWQTLSNPCIPPNNSIIIDDVRGPIIITASSYADMYMGNGADAYIPYAAIMAVSNTGSVISAPTTTSNSISVPSGIDANGKYYDVFVASNVYYFNSYSVNDLKAGNITYWQEVNRLNAGAMHSHIKAKFNISNIATIKHVDVKAVFKNMGMLRVNGTLYTTPLTPVAGIHNCSDGTDLVLCWDNRTDSWCGDGSVSCVKDHYEHFLTSNTKESFNSFTFVDNHHEFDLSYLVARNRSPSLPYNDRDSAGGAILWLRIYVNN